MNLNLFLKPILISIISLGYISCFSQDLPKIPTSPEAAALSKMVNYPLNLNMGLPDISIPLYTIESDGLKLPISLTYHSGGFNIHERSTRSGLGFSLSSDLQITRSVNGLDDFGNRGYISNSYVRSHYDNGSFDYPLFGSSTWMNAYRLAEGEVDGMPDKFTYKLLNKSGSFYFMKDNSGTSYTIVPVPYDNIKITYNDGEFNIVDTDGTSYVFGTTGSVDLDNLAAKYKEVTGAVVTAWKCRIVNNPTNTGTMQFSYQAKAIETYSNRSASIEYYYDEAAPDCFRPF